MREREGSILARESPKECCQHLAGELDESGGSCLAREGGQQPPLKRLGDQSRTGSVGAIIEPHDLPRAGNAPAEPEPYHHQPDRGATATSAALEGSVGSTL